MNNIKMTLQPELFSSDEEYKWREYLDKNGYVVIKNVLNQEEKSKYYEQFKKDWKTVAPKFDFEDKSTWKEINCPMNWLLGMIMSNGLGQSDFQWELRTNPKIREIWEKLYHTKELVVSFDGFSLFLSKRQNSETWLHIDEHPSEPLYSIQGAYNFFSVGEEDAGFIVVPGSHRTYNALNVDNHRKFILIEEDDPHVEKAVKLIIPENCFVLWNSKTIHANTGMGIMKSKEINRLTSYITYFPKEFRTEEIYKKRVNGYINAENCGHYAIYHHVKGEPYWDNTEFGEIEPLLDDNGDIPKNRLELL